MGDSRISVSVFRALQSEEHNDGGVGSGDSRNPVVRTHAFSVTLSADSTLRDLSDRILDRIGDSSSSSSPFGHKGKTKDEDGRSDDVGGGDAVVSTSPTASFAAYLSAYDLTLHPPRDVSGSFAAYRTTSGPGSKTLQDMGWFPSGRVALFRSDDLRAGEYVSSGEGGSRALDADEHQYNVPSGGGSGRCGSGRVEGSSRVRLEGMEDDGERDPPKPSEVFESVRSRFDGEVVWTPVAYEAADGGTDPRPRRTEAERRARIDSILRSLDKRGGCGKGRNRDVSDQVRKMLIKSRAEGDERVKERDKFFLELVRIDDVFDNDSSAATSSHRYFSRVSNAGRVASSVSGPAIPPGATVELLVVRPTEGSGANPGKDTGSFWRIPNLMTLHEAEKGGYLRQFERVVVRFCRAGDKTARTVLDGDVNGCQAAARGVEADAAMALADRVDSTIENGNATTVDGGGDGAAQMQGSAGSAVDNVVPGTDELELYRRISDAVEEASETLAAGGKARKNTLPPKKKKKKKKNPSATSEKVRQMLVRGKAKGDAKRVPKEEDRFYLEVVTMMVDGVPADGGKVTALASFHFLHRTWDVSSIVEIAAALTDPDGGEVLVEREMAEDITVYQRLAPDMRLCDAQSKGCLRPFERVVVRRFPSRAAAAMRCLE